MHQDSPLNKRLGELARQRQRFGYRRLTALLQREGWAVNHKKIYRLYREQGLALRRKKRGHRMRQPNAAAKNMLSRPNQRWAMDFVSDTLASGRPFRSLTIVDEYSRECPAIEVDTSLPGLRVLRVLQRMAETCGLPTEIRVDHGPEFVSRSVRSWCEDHQVLLATQIQVDQCRTGMSNPSTGVSATNALTQTGLLVFLPPDELSNCGAMTTTATALIALYSIERLLNLLHCHLMVQPNRLL